MDSSQNAVMTGLPSIDASVVTGSPPAAAPTSVGGAAGQCQLSHVTAALAAVLTIWLLFFSSFFTNFAGLPDSVSTYLPWLKRAGGHSPHIHPWYFYLQRLAWFHPAKGPLWSEGLILGLAIVGKILEDHGGGIELLDRPDADHGKRGARIRLWFPETGPAEEPAAKDEAPTRETLVDNDKQDGIAV